jgi:lipoprotein
MKRKILLSLSFFLLMITNVFSLSSCDVHVNNINTSYAENLLIREKAVGEITALSDQDNNVHNIVKAYVLIENSGAELSLDFTLSFDIVNASGDKLNRSSIFKSIDVYSSDRVLSDNYIYPGETKYIDLNITSKDVNGYVFSTTETYRMSNVKIECASSLKKFKLIESDQLGITFSDYSLHFIKEIPNINRGKYIYQLDYQISYDPSKNHDVDYLNYILYLDGQKVEYIDNLGMSNFQDASSLQFLTSSSLDLSIGHTVKLSMVGVKEAQLDTDKVNDTLRITTIVLISVFGTLFAIAVIIAIFTIIYLIRDSKKR